MDTEHYTPSTPETELEVVLADYLRAAESGERPDPRQVIDRHPHLADELRAFIANREQMERWAAPLRPAAPPAPPAGVPVFGPYELLEEIARGGMGIVHKARRVGSNRVVALKRMRTELALPSEIERFRAEAEEASNLDHPNIVPIYEVGDVNGQPYFTMKYINGGTLAQHMADFRLPMLDPQTGRDADGKAWSRAETAERKARIGRLMVQVARAVQHAHQHRILHRDLKPANILLDGQGQPHVTDFGLAKRVEGDAGLTLSGVIVGTPSYMAPEQAACAKVLTTADIWSFGAVLYELLAGRPPFVGRTAPKIFKQLETDEPPSSRVLNPLVDRDLEAICLKCLEKDPAQRYLSAEHLELWLRGEPVPVRPPSKRERLLRWCKQNPAAAALTAAAAVGLLVVTLTALSLARNREDRLREEVLNVNREMAGHVANSVLVHLEHLIRPLVQTTEHPGLRECLGDGNRDRLQTLIEGVHKKYDDPALGFAPPGAESPYKSWYVLDVKGRILAVSPYNPDVIIDPVTKKERQFDGRDYFQGALHRRGEPGGPAVHVSRIYLAINDSHFKFALSALVRDVNGKPIGVLATTIPTASTMGSLRLQNERRIAVLVGREDTNPQEGPVPPDPPVRHLILLHPAYRKPGERPAVIASAALERLQQRRRNADELTPPGPDAAAAADDHYLNPVGAGLDPAYAGRWLAGFAPVGNTEFVVVVQQRYDEALGPDRALALDLILRGAIARALAALLVGALVRDGIGRALRRRRAAAGRR